MKNRLFKVFSLITIVALMLAGVPIQSAQADNTVQSLPFSQDWTNTGLITVDDNWSGVPGIIGYRGDALTGGTGVDPQTVVADGTATPVDVTANQTNPNTFTTGGVAEFHLANPVVAFQGSGTARAPFLLLHLDTTGLANITVSYNLRDIDGSVDNSIQPVALQFRVGSSGNFTNVPAGFVADASTGPSLATLVTPVSAVLPAAANNQAVVQVRIITADAVGADEWIGIDDINVTGAVGDVAPSVSTTDPANGATAVAVNSNITVNFSEPIDAVAGAITVECPVGTVVASNTVVDALSSVVLDPTSDLPYTTTCTINAAASGITDDDANDPPDTMTANFMASFTTADAPPPPFSGDVVISQVYGGGGNTGATFTNDFVELFNRGTTAASLAGLSVQYASATGTGNFGANPVTLLSGTLAPGQYYLVQLASGGANGAAMPAPDATGTVNMSGTAGKVVLVNSTTGLACNGGSTVCSPAQLASIVDLVGYGTANFFEGSAAAPGLSVTSADFRNDDGCVDTDDNAADFAAATPAPRNTLSPTHSCINQPTVLNEVLASTTGADVEYIELYGEPNASLSGLSLIYVEGNNASGPGTIDFRYDFAPTAALGLNGFFLVGTTAGLQSFYGVTPNVDIATNSLENSSATVALVQTASLAGASVTGNEVVLDTVGITDATASTFYFGAPVVGPDGTFFPAGVRRVTDGVDTDTAADWVISDFNLGAANTPTAGTSADVPPTVTATNPAAGATNVPIGSDISVTFSETVDVVAGAISVECPAGNSVASNTAANDVTNVLINPTSDLPATTACVININAGGVTDNDGTADNLTGTTTFNFTTGTATGITPISAIQGNGNTSSAGTFTVEAIVVGDYQTQGSGQLRGFFIQEEDADSDGNAATSEGIFVFCSTCATVVSVGDQVRVTGAASEFNGLSELTASTAGSVTVLSSGNTLPTPATVELPVPGVPNGDLNAATAAINAYFEPFESMLVTFPDSLSVSEYFELARYGQLILSEGGRPHTFTAVNTPTATGYINDQINFAKRTIILDDTDNRENRPIDIPNTNYYHPVPGLSISNYVRGGDTITSLTGVLHWSFAGTTGTDAWRIRPVTEAYSYAFTHDNPRPPVPTVGGSIKVASFNVLNYFLSIDTTASENVGSCGPNGTQDCRGADSASELSRQRTKMLAALSALDADIYGFMEMENTTGVQPLADIIAGLPGYGYIDTGTIGGDAIRVGIIYKTTKVTPVGNYAVLTSSVDPRFIDTRNRPSLAQTFKEDATGGVFTVVVNHLKSKGSGCGAGDDDTTTGQGNCNLTRTRAAEALADWLAGDPTNSGDPDFLIIGDMNSYAKEDPIVALENAGFINMVAAFHGLDAYGYLFDGQIGYLDHAIASPSLSTQITGVEDWHINADEIPLFDYNDDVRDTGEADAFEEESDTQPLYEPNQFRTSDHDPVVIGLNLSAPPVANDDTYQTDEDTPLSIDVPGVLGNDTDANNNTLTAVLVSTTSNGALILNGDGSFSYTPNTNFNGSDSFTYKANDGSFDSGVATVNITVNAVNDAPVANGDNYITNEDTALTVAAPAVLSNDSDIENNTLSAVLVSNPSHGTVSLNADGSFTYTPNTNYNGSESFTYKANDGAADSNTATVSITVNAVNDAPVCTSPQSGSTNEDTVLNGSVVCSDVDNSFTYSKVGDPSHGTVTVNSDGTFTYTPSANYNGSDSFTFKANDGSADSNVATFNITIVPVNDNPDAVDDTATINKNSSGVILIYLNDTDIDGDTLTVISFTQPSHGTVDYSTKNRNFRYTPRRGFTGTDTFTYTISDGHGGTDTATVTITVP